MKRPLGVIGLVGLSAQCAALLVHPSLSLLFGVLLLATGCVLCLFTQWRKQVALCVGVFTASVVIAVTGGLQLRIAEPLRAFDGRQATVCGTIVQVEQDAYYTEITVLADAVTDNGTQEKLCENVRLTLYTANAMHAEMYTRVKIDTVALYAPQEGFGLSARSVFAAKGVYLLGSFSKYDCTVTESGDRPWYAVFSDLRTYLLRTLRLFLPDRQASVVAAMLLGERSMLSAEVSTQFRRSGLNAMLVVSGMHLSILIGGLLRLLHRLLRSSRAAALMCMPAVLLFMVLSGFGGSVTRAGISMLIYLLAIVAVRNADPINSLGAAAVVLLLTRPFVGGDVGVQLSFLATGGILTLTKPMRDGVLARLPRKIEGLAAVKALAEAFSVSIAATLFTTPLLVLLFGELSLVGPLANVLFNLPAQLLLLSGAAAVGFGAIGLSVLAYPAALLSGIAANIFIEGTHLLAQAPMLYNVYGTLTLWVAVVLGTFGVLLLFRVRRNGVLGAASVCMLLLLIPAFAGANGEKHPEVHILKCGNGIAVHATYGDQALTLLSAGNHHLTEEVQSHFAARKAGVTVLPDEAYSAYTAQAAAFLVRNNKTDSLAITSDYLPDEIRAVQPDCPVRTGVHASVRAGESIYAERVETKSGVWYYITVGEQRVLIPLTAEADAADLPPGKQQSEILVLTYPVAHPEDLRAKNIVLSCTLYNEAELLAVAANIRAEYYSVAQNGTLRMTFDAYGHLTTERA